MSHENPPHEPPHVSSWSNGPTGFPSPADLWRERPLSLDDLVLLHPSTTYFLRVRNQILQNLGICQGDLVVIDRSLDLVSGAIILATLRGMFILRRVRIQGATLWLESGHPRYPAFAVTPAMRFALWA